MKVFVAGATSFTGLALAKQDLSQSQIKLRLQVRPMSPNAKLLADEKRKTIVNLSNHDDLVKALKDIDCVIQLIGTTKSRFNGIDNYESVDLKTTKELISAAIAANVNHFILLSSVFAGLGKGAYLSAKKKSEAEVKNSGLKFTILRAGPIAGTDAMPNRSKMAVIASLLGGMSNTLLGSSLANIKPMRVDVLAKLLLYFANDIGQNRVVNGQEMWSIAKREKFYFFVC